MSKKGGKVRTTLYVRLEVAPMTRNVDKLTSRPRTAVSAMAATILGVYSKLSKLSSCGFEPGVEMPSGSNVGTRKSSSPAAYGQ